MKENQEETQETKESATHTTAIPHQGSASSPSLMISLFNLDWDFNGSVPVNVGEHILDYLDAKTLGLTISRINKAWKALTEGYLQKHPVVQKKVEEERARKKAEAKRKKEEESQARVAFQQSYDTARKLFESAELKTNLLLSLLSTTSLFITVSDPSNQEEVKEKEAIVLMLNQAEAYLAGKEDELTFKGTLQIVTKLPKEEMYVAWMQGFELLGDVYQQRGILEEDERQLLKSVTLYNLAIACKERYEEIEKVKEISIQGKIEGNQEECKLQDVKPLQLSNRQRRCIKKIKAIEEDLITSAGGQVIQQSLESYWEVSRKAKEHLISIRDEARLAIEQIDGKTPKVQMIYKNIAKGLRCLMEEMLENCFNLLIPLKDCAFSIVVLGSIAREEATPFSDLEWAILFEEQGEERNRQHKEYFRRLTELLWIKILNLGETTARMMDIQSLGWMLESESPALKGFSFDGQMADGCHTPLGNKHHTKNKIAIIEMEKDLTPEEKEKAIQKVQESKYELIGTPEELAQFQLDKWACKRGFSTVLSTVELVFSRNKTRLQESLVKQYEKFMENIWKEPISENQTRIQQRSLKFLAESSERFQFRGGTFGMEGHYFDAKYQLYRLPNMMFDHLASYFNIKAKSLWDRIEAIFAAEGVAANQLEIQYFRGMVSAILLLRLRAYLKKGYRDDHIIMFELNAGKKNLTRLEKYLGVKKEMILNIFSVLVPLEKMIKNFIATNGSKNALLRVRGRPLAVRASNNDYIYKYDPLIEGGIHELLLDYLKAMECYKLAIKEFPDDRKILNQLGSDYNFPDEQEILNRLGVVYLEQGEYVEAKETFQKVKEALGLNGVSVPMATTLNNLGIVYLKQSNYAAALEEFENALGIYEIIYGAKHTTIANVLVNIGNIYIRQENPQAALKVLKKAENIYSDIYGSENIRIAKVLNTLGSVYFLMKNYSKAEKLYEKAKRMYVATYGVKHILVATSLHNLGMVYFEQSNYETAVATLEEAASILVTIYGSTHIETKETLSCLAERKYKLGEVYRYKSNYKAAIVMFEGVRHIFESILGSSFIEVANLFYEQGRIYRKQFNYEAALVMYNSAKQIYMKHGETILVADTMNCCGLVLIEQGEFEKARSLFKQAIHIYSENNKQFNQIVIDKNLRQSYLREGNIFRLHGDFQQAAKYYQLYQSDLNLYNNPEAHRNLANQFYDMGSLSAAMEHIRILLLMNPGDVWAHDYLAYLLHLRAQIEKNKGDEFQYIRYLKEAKSHFSQGIALNPRTKAYTEYGQFLWKNRSHYNVEEIIVTLQKAIDLKQINDILSYRIRDQPILDKSLQQLIDRENTISFHAVFLAYYLLIQAYLSGNQVQKANQTLSEFGIDLSQLKHAYENTKAKLINNRRKINTSILPQKKAQAMFEQLQSQQHAMDKEQQLLDALLTFSQQAISAYNPSVSMQQASNNNSTEETIDAEFEAAIKLSLSSPSSKLLEGEPSLEGHSLVSTLQSLETETKESQVDEDAELQVAIALSLTKTNEEDKDKKDSTKLDTPIWFSSEENLPGNAALSSLVGSRTGSPLYSRSSSPSLEIMKEFTSQGQTQSDERVRIKREIIKYRAIIKELIEPKNMGENIAVVGEIVF